MTYRLATTAIGLIIAVYWARVMRMARKARARTGRAANLLPPEPLGRALRLIWTPIVILWIVQPFLVALSRPRIAALRPLYENPWIAWIAAAVTAGCLVASRACWRAMGRQWRMGIDPTERTELVRGGAFGRVRHPIYALSQVMMITTMIAVPSVAMLTAGALHILLLQWEARREESHLRRVHGQTYEEYCASVPRFVPRRHSTSVPRKTA